MESLSSWSLCSNLLGKTNNKCTSKSVVYWKVINSRKNNIWVRKRGRAGLGWGVALFCGTFEKAWDKVLF